MSLSQEQVELIQSTWSILYKDNVRNGVDFFIYFFTRYPDYKNFFPDFRGLSLNELKTSPKMQAHATTVMHGIQSWVENLDDLETLVELIRKNAFRHASRGLMKTNFHDLYKTLAEWLGEKLGARWTVPVQKAWTTAVTIMSSVTDGALDENRTSKY